MRTRLAHVVKILSSGAVTDPERFPWHEVRYQHVAAVRAALLVMPGRDGKPMPRSSANLTLSALRGVLREAWRLGQMGAEDFNRATDIESVRGSREPHGRALEGSEMRSLFKACAVDASVAGRRDAALIAVLYGAGIRRSEAAGLNLSDYNPSTGELKVLGKGNKQRTVYATNGSRDALQAWIAVRGSEPGPLFYPVNKGGRVLFRRMRDQAVYNATEKRAAEAGVKHFSPHDLRRSFVSDLLEEGGDLHQVQLLAGHTDPKTTSNYDRRPEAAKKRTAELLHVPYVEVKSGVAAG
jgi:site-specific recombinase XerC